MWLRPAVLGLALLPALGRGGAAWGQEIEPAAPTTCDSLTLVVTRFFASECGWSVTGEVARAGDRIDVLLTLHGNPICLPVVIGDRTFRVPLGSFPAGSYTVSVGWKGEEVEPLEIPLTVAEESCTRGFLRGDANGDGGLDLSDPVSVLFHLFFGGTLGCREAGDGDSSGTLELTDAVLLLSYLFTDGAPPGQPFPACEAPEGGFRIGCDDPQCDSGPVVQGTALFGRPDGCRQCEPCAAPSLEEVVQSLEEGGIEVLASGVAHLAVCLACTCPSGRFYVVQVGLEDAEAIAGQGFTPWKGELPGGK
ncbi:MAG: hypothetical protein ACRD2T_09195 [Thermoanaerobaculia bacterium]